MHCVSSLRTGFFRTASAVTIIVNDFLHRKVNSFSFFNFVVFILNWRVLFLDNNKVKKEHAPIQMLTVAIHN